MLSTLRHGTTRALLKTRSGPRIILSGRTAQKQKAPALSLLSQSSSPLAPCFPLSSFQSFSTTSNDDDDDIDDNKNNAVVYEGPFASLSLRLRRVSLTTAIISIGGIPLILFLQNSGGHALLNDVPVAGQLAVGGTALLAATGSTAALTFCFVPYVESLEWVAKDQGAKGNDKEGGEQDDAGNEGERLMLKATTRNLMTMKVETIFDPFRNSSGIGKIETEDDDDNAGVDVVHNPTNYRPFCNFEVRGRPFYVHPELVHDEHLRHALIGYPKDMDGDDTEEQTGTAAGDDGTTDKKKKRRKDPDDEFL